ncbi:MAG: DUF4169 family protein [Rhodospirillaceae bacterium]
MPAEIVSLNQYRKAKQKADKEGKARANRVRYGRPKDERRRDQDAVQRALDDIDGKRLEEDPDAGGGR